MKKQLRFSPELNDAIRKVAIKVHRVTRDDLPVAKGGVMVELRSGWAVEDLLHLNQLMAEYEYGWCDTGDFDHY